MISVQRNHVLELCEFDHAVDCRLMVERTGPMQHRAKAEAEVVPGDRWMRRRIRTAPGINALLRGLRELGYVYGGHFRHRIRAAGTGEAE